MLLLIFFESFIFSAIEEPIHKRIIKRGDEGSEFYRIPALAFAPDNKTLVAATDKRWGSISDLPKKIDIVIKLSYDLGKTWTTEKLLTGGKANPVGYGDPALIVDREVNAIFCFFTSGPGWTESTDKKPQGNHYCVSYDNGETWSDPVDITDMLYGYNCRDPQLKGYYSNFLTSGNGIMTRNGRLMLVGIARENSVAKLHPHVVYSDDHGRTWKMSPNRGVNGGDESKVIELNNGSILMDIRTAGKRRFTISNDNGYSWGPVYPQDQLIDPNCNGEIIRYTSTLDGYDKNRIIHTNLHSTEGRKNLVIMISYDEGETWKYMKVIEPSYCIYSSVATSPIDGKIYVYWEKSIDHTVASGVDMIFTTLTLEWITDGEDSWTPPKKR